VCGPERRIQARQPPGRLSWGKCWRLGRRMIDSSFCSKTFHRQPGVFSQQQLHGSGLLAFVGQEIIDNIVYNTPGGPVAGNPGAFTSNQPPANRPTMPCTAWLQPVRSEYTSNEIQTFSRKKAESRRNPQQRRWITFLHTNVFV